MVLCGQGLINAKIVEIDRNEISDLEEAVPLYHLNILDFLKRGLLHVKQEPCYTLERVVLLSC